MVARNSPGEKLWSVTIVPRSNCDGEQFSRVKLWLGAIVVASNSTGVKLWSGAIIPDSNCGDEKPCRREIVIGSNHPREKL